jgi:hypothetical protein
VDSILNFQWRHSPLECATETPRVIGRDDTNIVLTCQVLFLTTTFSFVARAGWSPAISNMALSVAFSRWERSASRGT